MQDVSLELEPVAGSSGTRDADEDVVDIEDGSEIASEDAVVEKMADVDLTLSLLEAFTDVMHIPGGNKPGVHALFDLCDVAGFLEGMQRVRDTQVAKKRLMGVVDPEIDHRNSFTVEEMLSFQIEPIPYPMLKMDDSVKAAAVSMFADVLRFMNNEGDKMLSQREQAAVISRLFGHLASNVLLRDELFMQMMKQTRSNPNRESSLRVWELVRIIASVYCPSNPIAGPLSEYFASIARDKHCDSDVRSALMLAWKALDHCLKHGGRKFRPSDAEATALIARSTMVVPVFLCDDSPENVKATPIMTVAEAMGAVLRKLQISHLQTFAMYTCRISKCMDEEGEGEEKEPLVEHILLDGSRYIYDVLSDYGQQAKGGTAICKLLLKKRYFLPADVAVEGERQFLRLCYKQLCYDYLTNHYLVTVEMAVALAALQIAISIGMVPDPDANIEWGIHMRRSIPRLVSRLRSKEEWGTAILRYYLTLHALDEEDCMRAFIHRLLTTPQGGAAFFRLKSVEDSDSIFPPNMILGINERGMHFMDSVVRTIMHVTSLKHISQYAGQPKGVFFSMMLHGQLQSFEFETSGGDEICLLLDFHIDNVLRSIEAAAA